MVVVLLLIVTTVLLGAGILVMRARNTSGWSGLRWWLGGTLLVSTGLHLALCIFWPVRQSMPPQVGYCAWLLAADAVLAAAFLVFFYCLCNGSEALIEVADGEYKVAAIGYLDGQTMLIVTDASDFFPIPIFLSIPGALGMPSVDNPRLIVTAGRYELR